MLYRVTFFFALFFCPISFVTVSAQVFHNIDFYGAFDSTITHSNTKVSTACGNKELDATVFGGILDVYLRSSLSYNALYFSFVPQFKMKHSKPQVLLKELLLSYGFDDFELSFGKSKETRYLTTGKDYLTVRNRDILFADMFSFWNLNMYVPLEYVTVEFGSKLVRTEYQYEWEEFDKAFSKNYLYADFDYGGFSAHAGYAYAYDIQKKSHEHDITTKISYAYQDIIGGYFAHLIPFTQGEKFSLKDYSYTLGLDFSFAKVFEVFGVDAVNLNNFDVKLNAEVNYEKEKHSIAPRLTFYYDQWSIFTVFSYTFDVGNMKNFTVIQYKWNPVTFRAFYRWEYFNIKSQHYKQKQWIHTFGLGVIYEF